MGEQPEFNIAEAWVAIAEAEEQLESDIAIRESCSPPWPSCAPTLQTENSATKRYTPCVCCAAACRASNCISTTSTPTSGTTRLHRRGLTHGVANGGGR